MRIWVDLTNSPHVLVMRPVIEALRREGHEVDVTARDFAQTLPLLERFGIEHTAIGRHRGERIAHKARGMASRSVALTRWARRRPVTVALPARGPRRRPAPFQIALGHGSNDLTIAAALLRIPSSTMFDYEWAALQHHINCRLAAAVVVPDAIPVARLARYGAGSKVRSYEGLKEEYYLADFEPEEAVLAELRLERTRPIVTVRTPPEVSLYHRFHSELFAAVLARLSEAARRDGVQPVALPRTDAQREQLRSMGGFILPERAIDAQSLIALSDLVVSGGGTMNREAVALGTPVCSTFAGRLGALDERLIADGRLTLLSDAAKLPLADLEAARSAAATPAASAARRTAGVRSAAPAGGRWRARVRRDPDLLVDLLLSPLAGGWRRSGS